MRDRQMQAGVGINALPQIWARGPVYPKAAIRESWSPGQVLEAHLYWVHKLSAGSSRLAALRHYHSQLPHLGTSCDYFKEPSVDASTTRSSSAR